MSQPPIIPLKPIPIKDRVSMIFVYYGRTNVKDGAFVVINDMAVRSLRAVAQIPFRSF